MQRRGGKKRFDNHDIEKQAAGTFVEKFPFLESMVIKIIYYQKGDNPILMSRTLHVYPEDFAYFHIPCLIHDCLEGTFELAPIVMNILKESKSRSEGQLACKGSLSKDLLPDHGYIEYTIEVTYKSGGIKPDTSEKQKEKVKAIEKKPEKEAPEKKKGINPPDTKKELAKPVKEAVRSNQETLHKKSVKTTEAAGSKIKVKTVAAKKLVKKPAKKAIATAKNETVASKPKVVKTSKSPAKKEAVKTKKLQKSKTSINVKKTSSKTKKKKAGSR